MKSRRIDQFQKTFIIVFVTGGSIGAAVIQGENPWQSSAV